MVRFPPMTEPQIVVGRLTKAPIGPGEVLPAVRISVKVGRRKVGGAIVWEEDLPVVGRIARVESVSLFPEYHRRGIGTQIYEAAARAACSVFRAPLASAGYRTSMSEGFWKKQFSKGRARKIVIKKPARKYGSKGKTQTVYLLSCPAPTSLKGVK